ncbi:uncharacterized protein LOC143249039 isoform X5 [Tachypleus tridentatus]|uniref:uncharacterized protein LOC143249039 isoform X5 n=1 Tax=Tachypleus tridentatus TaxID=6853 RepID=UPI003FD2D3B9
MERLSSKDQKCMETDAGDITNLNATVLSSDNQSILALAATFVFNTGNKAKTSFTS